METDTFCIDFEYGDQSCVDLIEFSRIIQKIQEETIINQTAGKTVIASD